jgi:hypothetical protein
MRIPVGKWSGYLYIFSNKTNHPPGYNWKFVERGNIHKVTNVKRIIVI